MPVTDRVRGWVDVFSRSAEKFDTYALATLFIIVVYHDANELLWSLFNCLAAIGLVIRRIRLSGLFWLVLGLTVLAQASHGWAQANNHDFLLGYWCVAIGLAALRPDPVKILARSGRLLIGLVFALAFAWKLMTPDYLSGDFFEKTILTDSRFEQFAYRVCGLPTDLHKKNDDFHDELRSSDAVEESISLYATPQTRLISSFVTIWTLLIEGLIAFAFLVGRPRQPAGIFFLAVFCVSTYLVAPIIGFGATLMLMACATMDATHRGWRTLALFLFGLFPAFDVIRKSIAG